MLRSGKCTGVSSPPLELESNSKDKGGKEEIKDVETIFDIEGKEKKNWRCNLNCLHLVEVLAGTYQGVTVWKEGREDPNAGLMAW